MCKLNALSTDTDIQKATVTKERTAGTCDNTRSKTSQVRDLTRNYIMHDFMVQNRINHVGKKYQKTDSL